LTVRTERILVMRYRFIGDTLLTVPFLRNLRLAHPDAFVAWMVAPGSSDVVKGIPYVDEMIYWDPATIHADSRGTHRTLSAKLRFIRDLRKKNFDKVYVLKRSLSSAIIAYLSGARERVGFDTEGRGFLLTKKVSYQHNRHEVENFLEVLRADSVPVVDDRLELWTTQEEDARVDRILVDAGIGPQERLIALHPFSAVVERGWPLENFGELAKRISTEQGARVLVIGGPKDRAAFDAKRALFGNNIVDLVGKIDLRLTAALLKRCSLFIGNDSGIMHLAVAAGTPLVALFGPQSPIKFGPWSKNAKVIYKGMACSPCKQKFFQECKPSSRMRPECMESITVSEVFDAASELIRSAGK
jgi:heptosyltransferase-2